jgi:glycosyltransferase involved in cell wall biosynthesis
MLPAFLQKNIPKKGSEAVKEGWLTGLGIALLQKDHRKEFELHVAYPVLKKKKSRPILVRTEPAKVILYEFQEDTSHPERYDKRLEGRLAKIIELVQPDVVHCFGTEYPHTLALARALDDPAKLLIGIQGLIGLCAAAYFADLSPKVSSSVTFRDVIRQDTIRMQQRKFELRGKYEREALRLAHHVTGRTDFDKHYAKTCHSNVNYHSMNETLRPNFYTGSWPDPDYHPFRIFISQGNYPLKGLHYILHALPQIRKRFPQAEVVVAGSDLTRYSTWKDKCKISAYGKYLRRLLIEGHIENAVTFAGVLNAEQMKKQYLQCGLYLCCSSLENSPNSLGEAMMLGVPCVCADVGGIPSLFWKDKDGICYEGFRSDQIPFYQMLKQTRKSEFSNYLLPESEESKEDCGKDDHLQVQTDRIINAITQMWSDEEKQSLYCEHAKIHAQITHDPEVNYHKAVEIYDTIIGSSSKKQ